MELHEVSKFGPFLGNLVAAKCPKLKTKESADALHRELLLIQKLEHKNIVKALGMFYASETPIMMMEYVRGRSSIMNSFQATLNRSLDYPFWVA